MNGFEPARPRRQLVCRRPREALRERRAVGADELDRVAWPEAALGRDDTDREQARTRLGDGPPRALVHDQPARHRLAVAQPELERRAAPVGRAETRPPPLAGGNGTENRGAVTARDTVVMPAAAAI